MQIGEKLATEIFLERLLTDDESIVTAGPEDPSASRLAGMAGRMMEVQQLQPPSTVLHAISSLSTKGDQFERQMAAMEIEVASLKPRLTRSTYRQSSSRRRFHS
nr:unnamed protein product [Spirometra erinaceieuropaei]